MQTDTMLKKLMLPVIFLIALITPAAAQPKNDAAANRELAATLAYKDSILFNAAFHTCNIKELETVLSKDFVFYHDNGYLNPTSTETHVDFTENIKKNFCDVKGIKMRREIVTGSMQVFAINNTEAMQTGVQRFYVVTPGKPDTQVEESKFSRKWQQQDGDWKMTMELDYLVNTENADHTKTAHTGSRYQPEPYVAEPQALYDSIVYMDSIYFDTYNTCNIEKMASLTSENLEFYHDRGGLMTSKKEYLVSIQKNICGKVTRELMPGSIEVYPIHGYGAVEIGYHRFHNNQEPSGKASRASKFIIIWHSNAGKWEIVRVVSLH